MIAFTMRIFFKPVSFRSILAISTAFVFLPAAIGQAQSYKSYPDVVVQTTGQNSIQTTYSATQSLPDLSPDAIAADVVSKYDPLSGRTEYLAQDFDPFEQDNEVAGSARLRSASSGMTRDGASVVGGAYLDVTVVYSSDSRDPWDGKRLEHGVYMNGQPVDYMSYDIQALDCQRDVTYVTYDDSYYRGASYGYLGGLYRPFPRYRGSSRYYRECDRIRYGNWRGLRDNYVDYSGYDRRWRSDRRLRSEIRETIHEIVTGEDGSYIDGDLDTRSDSTDVQERDLIMRMRDQRAISSHNVVAPDRLGDRRLETISDDLSNQPIANNRDSISSRGYTTSSSRQSRIAPELEQIRESGARAGVPRLSNAVPRLSNARTRIIQQRRETTPSIQRSVRTDNIRNRSNRSSNSEKPRNSERVRSAVKPNGAKPTVAAAQPSTRSHTKPKISRSNVRDTAKPKRSSSNRSTKRPDRSSSRKSSTKPKSTRSINRSFGDRMKTPSPRARRYYSGGSYTDRYEQNRCIKEERITLHIPEDRLRAARFDGLSIALLDQYGQDIPVYIPPNYVAGFLKGNPYLGRYGSSVTGSVAPGYYQNNPIR